MSVELNHRFDGPGDGPVLVLSNSLGTALEMWEDQLPTLTERFRVLRYDQRGHGGSPAPPGPYTVGELAGDVLALLDGLGLERVSWCGTSLGAMTGMRIAIDEPARIDRLALCCTSPHLGPPEMWAERAATVRDEGMAAILDAQLDRWFTPEFRSGDSEALGRTRRGLLEASPDGYASCCEAIAAFDVRDELGRIGAPTLVIAGSDDQATPPDHGRLIADSIDGARLVMIDGARHLAGIERPAEVSQAMMEHL
ncbi:MAG TPA: 3-oxoadipate enol-lactonase [Thermoleophilaceae bacterium]